MRRVARQAVELGDRRCARAEPSGLHRLDRGVERPHRHRHVAGMRRDAGIAAADHRMLAADAANRRAAAAGLAFVARLVGVVEIRTARALQQVAGGRRLVAQLAGRAGQQRARQHAHSRVRTRWIGREIGVAHQRADAQPALRRRLDPVERRGR